jgi:hypothetical protein
VTGAWTALAAGEPRTALDGLLRAQRAQPAPLVGAEALRLRIDEALAQREAAGGAPASVPAPEPPPAPARRRPPLMGLDEPTPEPTQPPAAPSAAEAPEGDGGGAWAWLAGLTALALAAGARMLLARRRRG